MANYSYEIYAIIAQKVKIIKIIEKNELIKN